MAKIIIAKNTTSSSIIIGDLSGAEILASGTRNLSEQFEFSRIADAPDLVDYITTSGIVINDSMGDLSVDEALRYISYDDATSVQNIPIADPGDSNLQDGFAIRYDEGQFSFDFDTFSVLELANFYTEDGSYYITNASGIKIQLSQNFMELGDTPVTYSGFRDDVLYVDSSTSGVKFRPKYHEDYYVEYTFSGIRVVQEDTWEDDTKVKKISSKVMQRSGGRVSQVTKYIYDYDTGTEIISTAVSTPTMVNGKVTKIDKIKN